VNRFFRSALFPLVVIVLLVWVASQTLIPHSKSEKKVTLSQFTTLARQGKVDNVLFALDAQTGQLKWHFQFTPHDVFDFDATETPILIDTVYQGQPRKLLVQANRNGFIHVLDRSNGKFLSAAPFVKNLTWAKGIDAQGRPIRSGLEPTAGGTRICPGFNGATNWYAPSYNEATRFVYFLALESCEIFYSKPQKFEEGKTYYCKREKVIGSTIPTLQCITESQLRNQVETMEELRGRMRGRRAFVVVTIYLALLSLLAFAVYVYLKQTAVANTTTIIDPGFGRPGMPFPGEGNVTSSGTALSAAIGPFYADGRQGAPLAGSRAGA
jgi:hypothetical protein